MYFFKFHSAAHTQTANGICIPKAYTSYITPISTPKLFAEVHSGHPALAHSLSPVEQKTKAAETPYVVYLKAVTYIAGQGRREDMSAVQSCWTFDHSAPAAVACSDDGLSLTNAHNIRTSTHTFHIPRQSVCHGLAGFFEAHLFGDVLLSIHPDRARHTDGMLSWFPIFFPFKVRTLCNSSVRIIEHTLTLSLPPHRSHCISAPIRSWTCPCGG